MRSQLRKEPRPVNDGLDGQLQCELPLVGKSADDNLFDGIFSRADDFGVFGLMYSPFSPFSIFYLNPLIKEHV